MMALGHNWFSVWVAVLLLILDVVSDNNSSPDVSAPAERDECLAQLMNLMNMTSWQEAQKFMEQGSVPNGYEATVTCSVPRGAEGAYLVTTGEKRRLSSTKIVAIPFGKTTAEVKCSTTERWKDQTNGRIVQCQTSCSDKPDCLPEHAVIDEEYYLQPLKGSNAGQRMTGDWAVVRCKDGYEWEEEHSNTQTAETIRFWGCTDNGKWEKFSEEWRSNKCVKSAEGVRFPPPANKIVHSEDKESVMSYGDQCFAQLNNLMKMEDSEKEEKFKLDFHVPEGTNATVRCLVPEEASGSYLATVIKRSEKSVVNPTARTSAQVKCTAEGWKNKTNEVLLQCRPSCSGEPNGLPENAVVDDSFYMQSLARPNSGQRMNGDWAVVRCKNGYRWEEEHDNTETHNTIRFWECNYNGQWTQFREEWRNSKCVKTATDSTVDVTTDSEVDERNECVAQLNNLMRMTDLTQKQQFEDSHKITEGEEAAVTCKTLNSAQGTYLAVVEKHEKDIKSFVPIGRTTALANCDTKEGWIDQTMKLPLQCQASCSEKPDNLPEHAIIDDEYYMQKLSGPNAGQRMTGDWAVVRCRDGYEWKQEHNNTVAAQTIRFWGCNDQGEWIRFGKEWRNNQCVKSDKTTVGTPIPHIVTTTPNTVPKPLCKESFRTRAAILLHLLTVAACLMTNQLFCLA